MFFEHLQDGDSTTSLGSLFQCLTTFSVKKFFLIFSLNLPWCNLMHQDQTLSGCTSFLFCPALNFTLVHLVRKLEDPNTWTIACCSHSLPDRVMLPLLHSASWDGTCHKESNADLSCLAWCFHGCLTSWELQKPEQWHWHWLCWFWVPCGLPLRMCRQGCVSRREDPSPTSTVNAAQVTVQTPQRIWDVSCRDVRRLGKITTGKHSKYLQMCECPDTTMRKVIHSLTMWRDSADPCLLPQEGYFSLYLKFWNLKLWKTWHNRQTHFCE